MFYWSQLIELLSGDNGEPKKAVYHTLCPSFKDSPDKDYRKVNEFDNYDPYHSCKIGELICLDHQPEEATYLIYLDRDFEIVWCTTNAARKASPEMQAILHRMATLEAMPLTHLSRGRRKQFNKLLANGLKHFLSSPNGRKELKRAQQQAYKSFDKAETLMHQWNFDFAYRWYAVASLLLLYAVVYLVYLASNNADNLSGHWDFIQYAYCGALGAMLFFLAQLRWSNPQELLMEVSGNRIGFFTTVLVKLLVGGLSAVVVGAAINGQLLLGALSSGVGKMPRPFTISGLSFVACILAGYSETLVPRFLTNFESATHMSKPTIKRKRKRKPRSDNTNGAGI